MARPALLFQLWQAQFVGDAFEQVQFTTCDLATKLISCYLIDFYRVNYIFLLSLQTIALSGWAALAARNPSSYEQSGFVR